MGFLSKTLSAFGGGSQGALNIAGLGLTGLQAFRGFDGPKIPGEFRDAMAQAARIRNALMNPNDPLFRQLEQQELETISGDIAEGFRRLRIQDRRQRGRTGIGILSGERRDEAIAQASARAVADAKGQARENTRRYLSAALGANNAVLGAASTQAGFNQQRFAGQQQALGALAQGAFGLAGGMQENQRQTEMMKFLSGIMNTGGGPLTGSSSRSVNPSIVRSGGLGSLPMTR